MENKNIFKKIVKYFGLQNQNHDLLLFCQIFDLGILRNEMTAWLAKAQYQH